MTILGAEGSHEKSVCREGGRQTGMRTREQAAVKSFHPHMMSVLLCHSHMASHSHRGSVSLCHSLTHDQSQMRPLSHRDTWCHLHGFTQLQGYTNSNIQSHAITLLKAWSYIVIKTHSHNLTYYYTALQYHAHWQTWSCTVTKT